MEQRSSRTEASSVRKQVGVEHEMRSNSAVCHNDHCSTAESPGANILERAEKLLQLRQGEGQCFVEDVLSISQRADLEFSNFRNVLEFGSNALR